MSHWIELPDCPDWREGDTCWKWIEGKGLPPVIDQIPRNYSRERDHCGGIWVYPLQAPRPPQISEVDYDTMENP